MWREYEITQLNLISKPNLIMYHAVVLCSPYDAIHIYMYIDPLKWKISCFCCTRAPQVGGRHVKLVAK